jgi:hypothetical protein
MIKQDYLVRMIQEIITLIADALLRKQRIRPEHWVKYDSLTRQILGIASSDLIRLTGDEVKDRYTDEDPNRMGKIEMAAMTMLKISDEMKADNLVDKSRLKQEGIALLEYVQQTSGTFSLQRAALLGMLKAEN